MTTQGRYETPWPQKISVAQILAERARQERLCAEAQERGIYRQSCADPDKDSGDKLAILMEEVGEVAHELCEARALGIEPGPNLRVELVQVAAVALAWVEALNA